MRLEWRCRSGTWKQTWKEYSWVCGESQFSFKFWTFKKNRDFPFLHCLLWTCGSFPVVSALQWKIYFCLPPLFLTVLTLSLSSSNSAYISDSFSLSLAILLSYCRGNVAKQTVSQLAPVYTIYASPQQRWLEEEGRERDSASILFIVSHLVLRPPLFVYCCVRAWVRVCLSSSLPHTFADVIPDANIMAPITLEPATCRSAVK